MKRIFVLLLCATLAGGFTLPALAENQALRVYFAVNDKDAGWMAFSQRHPAARIQRAQDVYYESANELIQALKTSALRCDVLGINTINISLPLLIAKEMLTDLSQNANITRAIQRMYPAIQKTVALNGQAYALPLSISLNYVLIHRDVWEECGLDTAHIPDTADELLAFLEDWCIRIENAPVEGVSVLPIDAESYTAATYAEELSRWLIDSYCIQAQYAGSSLTDTDEALSDLLNRCQTVGQRLHQSEKRTHSADGMGKALLELRQRTVWKEDYRDVVFLRFSKDQPKLFMAYLNCSAIPAQAEQGALALELLGDLAAQPNESKALLLYPDAQPVIDPFYAENRANVEYWIKERERQLQSGQLPQEKREMLEDQLKSLYSSLAKYNTDEGKYVMTREKLEEYRRYVAPFLCFRDAPMVQ